MMKMGTGSLLGAQKQTLGAVVLSLVLLAMCALPLAAAAQVYSSYHSSFPRVRVLNAQAQRPATTESW